MSDKDLIAEGLSLLAANSGMSVVYMAKNGQGFAEKHDAEVMNNKLKLKGKEGGAIKVKRSGNEDAISALIEKNQAAHEEAVAASLEEQARIRAEKKALKEAKKANRKGERVDVGGDSEALEVLKAENEELKNIIADKDVELDDALSQLNELKDENAGLKAKIAELEAAPVAKEPAAKEPAAEEPAAEEPAAEEPAPAPKKAPSKKKK